MTSSASFASKAIPFASDVLRFGFRTRLMPCKGIGSSVPTVKNTNYKYIRRTVAVVPIIIHEGVRMILHCLLFIATALSVIGGLINDLNPFISKEDYRTSIEISFVVEI